MAAALVQELGPGPAIYRVAAFENPKRPAVKAGGSGRSQRAGQSFLWQSNVDLETRHPSEVIVYDGKFHCKMFMIFRRKTTQIEQNMHVLQSSTTNKVGFTV